MNFAISSKKDNSLDIFFIVNSLLVFWYFSTSVIGEKGPGTTTLALLAIIFIIPAFKKIPDYWSDHKYWIFALLAYGTYHIGYFLVEGIPISDDYDKPAKALAAILVFAYLMKYGFSDRVIGYAIVISTLICGGYALYEKFFLDLSRAGTMTHPIRYGYLVITMALLCFFYGWFSDRKYERYVFFIVGFLGLIGASSTGTRGIVVILAFLIGIFLAYQINSRSISWKKISIVSALLLAVIMGIELKTDFFKRYVDETLGEIRDIESGNLNTSIGARIQMWHTALYLGSDHVFFGVGHDRSKIIDESAVFIAENGYNPMIVIEYKHFHNQYIDSFAKEGVFGLVIWCFLLFGALAGMKTKYRYAVIIIVSTLAVGGLTEAVLRSSRLFYLLVLGISIFRCLDYFEYKRQSSQAS